MAVSDSRAIFLVARDREAIVGTVQLHPAWAPNQPHRGDIAKLIVHRRARGAGLAAALMRTIEANAREAGFRLLTLDAKQGGSAERLYRRMGWIHVGTIPRYAVDPDGKTPHELIHVRRRDWLFQLLEEGVRTLLWFHPAIWWLIGRIQLTREQVVDQASVAVIESRERYVEALLAVAIAKSPGIFTPAPAFLRRSLLKKRVAQILQESTMVVVPVTPAIDPKMLAQGRQKDRNVEYKIRVIEPRICKE